MSINMSIKDNGVATTMTVDKLKIPSLSAGSENWTPIDGALGRLVKVTTGQNGIIESEGLNAYGISEITVNQSGNDPTSSTDSAHIPLEKHTTAISVGGVKRYMTAKKVRVNLDGGGTCDLWNMSDDGLKTLTIQRKGTYKAREYNAYGFSRIDVSLPSGGESGKENGWDEAFDGKGLPAYIRITQNPTKMDYTDGETMDYTGIVVHAYNSDGIDMGAVPFNELVFPVTEVELMDSEWTDGNGINAKMIFYTQQWVRRENIRTGVITEYSIYCCNEPLGTDINGRPATYYNSYSEEIGAATLLVTRYNGLNYMAAITGDIPIKCNLASYFNNEVRSDSAIKYTGWISSGGSTLSIGKLNKFFVTSWSEYLTDIPVSTENPTKADINEFHGTKKIPVQWKRTGDGKLLETKFEINITAASA